MGAPSKLLKVRLAAVSTPIEHIAAFNRAQDNIGATLDPLALNVGRTPIMGAAPPPYIFPDLQPQWAITLPFQAPAFHKDALGYVWCIGAVENVSGADFQGLIYTLPVGYRPKFTRAFAAPGGGGTALVTIDPNGQLSAGSLIPAGSGIGLEAHFLAEQ